MNEIEGCVSPLSVRITQIERSKGVVMSLALHHYRRKRKISASTLHRDECLTDATAALSSEKDFQKFIK